MESNLTQDLNKNRKNGTSSKAMSATVLRDRNGSFEPEIVKKITHMSDQIEKKALHFTHGETSTRR